MVTSTLHTVSAPTVANYFDEGGREDPTSTVGKMEGGSREKSSFISLFKMPCDYGFSLIGRGLFSKEQLSKCERVSYQRLKELSGSWHLAEFIKRVKPLVVSSLFGALNRCVEKSQFRGKSLVQGFLSGEENSLRDYFSAVVMRISATYGRTVGGGRGFTGGSPDFSTRYFEKLMITGAKAIDSVERHLLAEAMKSEEAAERGERLVELFRTPARKMIEEILPRGEEELFLGNNWPFNRIVVPLIWKGVVEEVVPSVLKELYLIFYPSEQHEAREVALMEEEGGALFSKLVTTVSEKVAEELPELVEKEVEAISSALHGKIAFPKEVGESLRHWLKSKLKALACSSDSEMKNLWRSLSLHIRASLLKYSLQIAGERAAEEKGNILCKVAGSFFDIVYRAFSEPVEEDRIKRSKRVAEVFFKALGLDEEEALLYGEIRERVAPSLVVEMVGDIEEPLQKKEEWVKRLNRVLYRPPSVKSCINEEMPGELKGFLHELFELKGEEAFEPIEEKLWSATGTRKIVDDIGCVVRAISKELTLHLRKEMSASPLSFVNAVEQSLSTLDLSSVEKEELSQLITYLADGNEPGLESLYSMIYRQLDSFLFKSVALQICRVKEREKNDGFATLPLTIALELLESLGAKFKALKRAIEEDTDGEGKASEEAVDLAEALVKTVIDDLEGTIPLPRAARKRLKRELLKTTLPNCLTKATEECCSWIDKNSDFEQRLYEIFKSSYPSELFRVLEHLFKEFFPYCLLRYNEDIAETVVEIVQKFFEGGESAEAEKASEVLKGAAPSMTALLADSLAKLSSCEGSFSSREEGKGSVEELFSFAALYLKAMLMQVGCKLGEKLKEVEKLDEERRALFLVEEVALPVIELLANHLSTINRVKDRNRTEACALSREALTKGFKENLHKATVRSKSVSSKERKRVEVDEFYRPLAKKILSLLELDNPDLFPFPSAFKKPLFQLLSNDLLPRIMLTLVDKLSQPRSINKILIHLLDILDHPSTAGAMERKELPKEMEEKFFESCGYLIEEVVALLPDTALRLLFKSKNIKQISSAEIGDLLITKLSSSSMIEMINSAIYFFLPMIHEGEFQGKERDEHFVPQKVRIGPAGEVVKEPSSYDMQFPKTKEGIKIYKAQKIRDGEEVNRRVAEKISKLLAEKIPLGIHTHFSTKWRRLQERLDNYIRDHFGEVGVKIKEGLDKICSFLIFVLLFKFLYILFYPCIALAQLLFRRHIALQAKEIVKLYQMDIHQNGFFNAVDRLVPKPT